MFGKRKAAGHVEPDLPITPMLDMSFQLLAFFIFTFHPRPVEGQLMLPAPYEGKYGPLVPSVTEEAPASYVVRVEADENGTIRNMTIEERGTAVGPVAIGADVKAYFAELERRSKELKGRPGKLTLEVGEGLRYVYVVQLLDHGTRAGFADIAPVPMDPRKR